MPHPPRMVTANGRTLTLEQWAESSGLSVQTIRSRLDRLGWTPERAVSEKADKRFRTGGRPRRGEPRPCPKLHRDEKGTAYVRWRAFGRDFYRSFGRAATTEAADAYRRFAAEWASGAFDAAPPSGSGELFVGELIARWLAHCDREYRKLGARTSEYHICLSAAREVARLYADTPAAEFGPAQLRAVRDVWVKAEYARTTVNGYGLRVVRMFRWGLSHSLVPAAVVAALEAVPGLREGRTGARETEKRKPVSDADVDVTLACLSIEGRGGVVRQMAKVQRLAGLRPQHVCEMRAGDLDRTGEVWKYLPPAVGTKTLHLGKRPAYYFGPKAQAVLAPLLDGKGPADHVFTWKRGERTYRVTRAAYGLAIGAACVRAGVSHWTPHQLRHALATEVAERFRSLDTAAAAIGDSNAVAGAVYVHVDPHERARIEVARAMG